MTVTPDIEVRRPRPDDLPAVVRIEVACFSDPWDAASLSAELREDRMRRPLCALRDGKVVGYLMAWKVTDEWHVINVAVSTGERRSGVGTILLDASLDAAISEGCVTATLEVRVSNAPALAFYEHHGFAAFDRRRRYYRDTGEDALVMIRVLRSGETGTVVDSDSTCP